MASVTSHTESVILTNGIPSTPASPGSYFGYGINAAKTASTGTRIYTGDGFPNGVLTAPLGSLWINNTSVAGSFWINTNGATEWFELAMNYNLPFAQADPGTGQAISVDFSGTINLTIGAGAETNTLATPTIIGQTLRINADTVGGGTRAITCSQDIDTANNVMTFDAVRDSIELVGVTVGGALRWQVAWNNNVALT
jgi:hypothetical protein